MNNQFVELLASFVDTRIKVIQFPQSEFVQNEHSVACQNMEKYIEDLERRANSYSMDNMVMM